MEIEICTNSRQSAQNALAGGATRIELCRRLDVGGLTPSPDDIDFCVHQLNLRTHVLVRPREGDFCYSFEEYDIIRRDVGLCRQLGAHAVVVGFLTPDGRIDEERTRHIRTLSKLLRPSYAAAAIASSPRDAAPVPSRAYPPCVPSKPLPQGASLSLPVPA